MRNISTALSFGPCPTVAIFDWRCRPSAFSGCHCRALHLTDSVVALWVAVKGRSSASSARFLKNIFSDSPLWWLRSPTCNRILPSVRLCRFRGQPGGCTKPPLCPFESLLTKEPKAKARKRLSKTTEEKYAAAFAAFRLYHKLARNFRVHNCEELENVVAEYI